jgi:hypothetical protein
MDGSLESLIKLYVFPTGRRLFALQQVLKLALAQGFGELTAHCQAAIQHDQATLVIERRYAGEPAAPGTNPAAQRLDALVDRTLTAIRDHAVAQTEGAPESDPVHAEVAGFLKVVYPTGVSAITSLGYVEELAAVDQIVGLFQGDLAASVTSLGLDRLATRLADLAGQYREALEAPPPSLITYGKVREARAEGQGLLLEAVAIILGKHHKRTAEGTADRLTLLAPILKQDEAIGAYLRSRRGAPDVDPETGEDAQSPAGPSQPE